MDDKALSLPTTAPSAQVRHTPLKSPPLGKMTALNPLLSGFTLRFPLLRHAGVPLESVLGKEREKGAFFVRCLICVDAFVLSFKFSMLVSFGVDIRKYGDRSCALD